MLLFDGSCLLPTPHIIRLGQDQDLVDDLIVVHFTFHNDQVFLLVPGLEETVDLTDWDVLDRFLGLPVLVYIAEGGDIL